MDTSDDIANNQDQKLKMSIERELLDFFIILQSVMLSKQDKGSFVQ